MTTNDNPYRAPKAATAAVVPSVAIDWRRVWSKRLFWCAGVFVAAGAFLFLLVFAVLFLAADREVTTSAQAEEHKAIIDWCYWLSRAAAWLWMVGYVVFSIGFPLRTKWMRKKT